MKDATMNFPFVDKIARHRVISALMDRYINRSDAIEEDMVMAKPANLESKIVAESVRHQVLCPLTAFLCVGKKLMDGQQV